MELTTENNPEFIARELEKTKAYVTSAEMIENQIASLERVIASCKLHSGIQSSVANNLTINLIRQLRFSTAAMFLSHKDLIGHPATEGFAIPRIL